MAIPKILKLWEISWLELDKGGVNGWLYVEEVEECDGEWDLFRSQCSWSVSWSF